MRALFAAVAFSAAATLIWRVQVGLSPAIDGCTLDGDGIRVRASSHLDSKGRLHEGRAATCSDERARSTVAAAKSALSVMPSGLRPEAIALHVMSRATDVVGVEFHAPSGALLVEGVERRTLDGSVWLHEIAHVRLKGQRPSGIIGRRLVVAVEEAVADYFAAVIGGTPRLGRDEQGQPLRDLSAPPPSSAAAWARYLMPGLVADPHELGWRLAGELWSLAPADRSLLEDLVAMLSSRRPFSDEDGAAVVAKELLQRCPPRSRERLRAALRRWTWDGLVP